jgi:Lon protease-like protein
LSTLTTSERALLRIFPLPGVVLFPHGVIPLHVFEPRYVQLVEDCLADDLPFAPWGIDPRGPAAERGPALLPVATAGRIRSHRRHADGRYDIVVEGLERVRLMGEQAMDAPYRAVEVEQHPLESVEREHITSELATLHGINGVLAIDHPRAARLLQVTLDRWEDPGALSDVLCAIVHDDPKLRQHLLETSDVKARLARVIETLGTLVLRTGQKAPGMKQ